jgi:hypothetical protein
VNEQRREAWIGITDQSGSAQILREPMSLEQLADYQAHKDYYFGRSLPVGGKVDDPFELFEWFVKSYRGLSREQLLASLAGAPNIVTLRAMGHDDLLYEYCEMMVGSVWKLPGRRQPDEKAVPIGIRKAG